MIVGYIVLGILAVAFLYDVFQKKHAILRNFPVLGHFRYLFELIGPELRQYIVAANNEERPFNRDQRSWVYASAKKQNNYFGFGTDNDLEGSPNHFIIKGFRTWKCSHVAGSSRSSSLIAAALTARMRLAPVGSFQNFCVPLTR